AVRGGALDGVWVPEPDALDRPGSADLVGGEPSESGEGSLGSFWIVSRAARLDRVGGLPDRGRPDRAGHARAIARVLPGAADLLAGPGGRLALVRSLRTSKASALG